MLHHNIAKVAVAARPRNEIAAEAITDNGGANLRNVLCQGD